MSAELQPVLTGETIALRPLSAEDWEALYAVASDPEIWAIHPAHDRHEEPVFRRFFAKALESGGALVAIDRATGTIIGSSRYDRERAGPSEIEIGYTFLARSQWGGATNREMKRLMLAHAFTFADAAIFLVGETNLRSRRAMEKIGGRLTDRVHHAEVAGKPVVHVIYEITADEFAAGPLMRGAG